MSRHTHAVVAPYCLYLNNEDEEFEFLKNYDSGIEVEGWQLVSDCEKFGKEGNLVYAVAFMKNPSEEVLSIDNNEDFNQESMIFVWNYSEYPDNYDHYVAASKSLSLLIQFQSDLNLSGTIESNEAIIQVI